MAAMELTSTNHSEGDSSNTIHTNKIISLDLYWGNLDIELINTRDITQKAYILLRPDVYW